MEKGIFLGDVGATKSRGTAHVEEEEEEHGELGRGCHSDQKCRTKTGNHLTAALLLTSSGSGHQQAYIPLESTLQRDQNRYISLILFPASLHYYYY